MGSRHTRREAMALGVGVAGAIAGCLGSRSGGTATGGSTPEGPRDSSAAPPAADRSPLVTYGAGRLRDETVSGGVPKDGIPSVDDPSLADADEATFLRDDDLVFGVVRGDDVRAYPRKILVHHEIVNDRLDGVAVSVTYCPLTGTTLGFERGSTTFGVSGNLVNSNLVMYDRATDSRWPQVLSTAVEGPLAGRPLREFDLVWTRWSRWRTRHPETTVLSERTGYARNYGVDPYGSYAPRRGYYARDSTMFDPLATDDRLGPKAVVVGVRTATDAVAVTVERLRERGVVTVTGTGDRFAFVHDAALDATYTYRVPPDVTVESTTDDAVRVDGTRHAPDAVPLERLHGIESMWFAWAGFYPETTLYA